MARELAIDAAHYIECNAHLLLSFDGGGSVGAIVFGTSVKISCWLAPN